MCNHARYELIPVFDEAGNIECADGILVCSLLRDAEVVLLGIAEYAEALVYHADGWHRELAYRPAPPLRAPEYDPEIPF